jgi:hypothetical protein
MVVILSFFIIQKSLIRILNHIIIPENPKGLYWELIFWILSLLFFELPLLLSLSRVNKNILLFSGKYFEIIRT